MDRQIIEADLTWTGARFEKGVRVVIEQGRIAAVERGDKPVAASNRLKGRALLPGFVNAHSHAFQRGLRGRGETFAGGAGSFWSWREAMYGLVESMTADRIFELSRLAFEEMLDAGITTVGEFHYLHHDASEAGYAFDEAVLHAAKAAGIRMVLLNAYYATGGIGQPLAGGQRRFGSESLSSYWAQMDRLERHVDGDASRLGAVAHSIRAATIEDVVALHAEAKARGMVTHMHVEEQRQEIEACVASYGETPMRLLVDRVAPDSSFTAVHCTHSGYDDLGAYADAGANICICPLTEANLGDGVADLPRWLETDVSISIGTDSNARISMLEEMRWQEYVQRLTRERRGVCMTPDGDVGARLLHIGTQGGARSLGVPAGAIEAGAYADFCAVDLTHRSLREVDEAGLAAALTLGAPDEVVADVCVGGCWRSN